MKTKEKLKEALVSESAPSWMIEKAAAGHYDDFESPFASPIMQLVADAELSGLFKIARRAIGGEFDGTSEEAEAWRNGKEGRNVIKDILNDQ